MSTTSSTPSRRRAPPNRPGRVLAWGLAAAGLLASVPASGPACAQVVVYDPRNHLESALQTARQLESLANEARSLARSPYSHLAGSSRSLRDMAELARTVRGLSASLGGLETQLRDLYPADVTGADVLRLLEQGRARNANARRTAEDVARLAVELERMSEDRNGRLGGALSASETADGQTSAVQASNQLLAVLAEDLAALRALMLAQSRLLAEAAAREQADRAAGDEARRRRWAGEAGVPAAPRFNPFGRSD